MPAFGWGIRSHFSHWFFGFSYQVAALKFFSLSGDLAIVTSCLPYRVPLSDGIKHSGS